MDCSLSDWWEAHYGDAKPYNAVDLEKSWNVADCMAAIKSGDAKFSACLCVAMDCGVETRLHCIYVLPFASSPVALPPAPPIAATAAHPHPPSCSSQCWAIHR